MRQIIKIVTGKKPRQVLEVGVLKIAEYYEFEIRSTISWQKYIQTTFALIGETFSEQPLIAMSQYIDESQGMLPHRDIILNELNAVHNLQVEQTKGYDSYSPSAIQDREYVVHASGVLEINWLRKLLRFDGGGLSPIIYGHYQQDPNWLNTIIGRNKTFVSWYYLKIEKEAVVSIANEVGAIAWGSDGWLYLLVNEEKKTRIEQVLTEVTKKYDVDWIYI